MIRTLLAVAVVAAGMTSIAAQSDPISLRRGIMKEVGAQTKAGAAMAKGEEPFAPAKAQAVFATYVEAATKMPAHYPENSKAGGDTTAAPKIWEDMNGFKASFAKFEKDAKAAQASVKDLDSFKTAFGATTKNCGGCHESYRIKKN